MRWQHSHDRFVPIANTRAAAKKPLFDRFVGTSDHYWTQLVATPRANSFLTRTYRLEGSALRGRALRGSAAKNGMASHSPLVSHDANEQDPRGTQKPKS